MKSLEFVLDLGIGLGGEYCLHDDAQTIRIGLDNDFYALATMKSKAKYVSPVLAEADLVEDLHLPFRDETFDRVEIYFPSDELLYNLCTNDSELLWCDLRRVLKDKGVVDIMIDVPHYFHMRGMFVSGRDLVIFTPEYEVYKTGQENGFSMITEEVDKNKIKSIGTDFSEFALRGEGFSEMDVYRIIATKISNQA